MGYYYSGRGRERPLRDSLHYRNPSGEREGHLMLREQMEDSGRVHLAHSGLRNDGYTAHLAHGIEWKNHKYIKKIGEGANALYFYTLGELKAYLHSQQNRAQQPTRGNPAAAQSAPKTGSQLVNQAKNVGQKVVNYAKDKAGFDEKERHQQAQSNLKKAGQQVANAHKGVQQATITPGANYNQNIQAAQQNLQAAKAKQTQAQKEAETAEKEYRDTLVGRIDTVKERIGTVQNETVISQVAEMCTTAASTWHQTVPGTKIKVDSDPALQNNVKKIIQEAKKLQDAYTSSTDKKERKQIKDQLDYAEKLLDDMYKEADKYARSDEGKQAYIALDEATKNASEVKKKLDKAKDQYDRANAAMHNYMNANRNTLHGRAYELKLKAYQDQVNSLKADVDAAQINYDLAKEAQTNAEKKIRYASAFDEWDEVSFNGNEVTLKGKQKIVQYDFKTGRSGAIPKPEIDAVTRGMPAEGSRDEAVPVSELLSGKAQEAIESAKKKAAETVQEIQNAVQTAKTEAGEGIEKVKGLIDRYLKKTEGDAQEHMETLSNQAAELAAEVPASTGTENSPETADIAEAESGEKKRPGRHQKTVSGEAKEGWSKRGEAVGSSPVLGTEDLTVKPASVDKDLEELFGKVNDMIDTSISIDGSAKPKEQIDSYIKGVDAKYKAMYQTDPAKADAYTKDQIMVIAAMYTDQYMKSQSNYQKANARLEPLKKDLEEVEQEYREAKKAFEQNKKNMSREERKQAEEQLSWKKTTYDVAIESYFRQFSVVENYASEMNEYYDRAQLYINGIKRIRVGEALQK